MSASDTTATAHVRIINENGLHARPSALIAQTAKNFQAEIQISTPDATVNARSIMGLITLCAFQGTKISIWARGKDAREAVDAMAALFESGFEEVYKEK